MWKRPTVHQYPSWAALCQNREKVTEQFCCKLPPNAKRARFDLSYLEKWPLERFNQIYLSIFDVCHPKEAPCQKRKKLVKRFWDDPSPTHDGQTDGLQTTQHSAGGAKNRPTCKMPTESYTAWLYLVKIGWKCSNLRILHITSYSY